MKLIMTLGLPGSGKSTWAKAQVEKSRGQIKRVNKDDLRAMIDSGVHSRSNEKNILQVRDSIVKHYLSNGFSVIVDDTNLAEKHEVRLREIAQEVGATFQTKSFLDVGLLECIKRDLKRPESVGEHVIKTMYNTFLRPKVDVAQYRPDPNLPKAIICDIDGTLAHMNGRSPYDYTKVSEDTLDEVVANWLKDVAWFDLNVENKPTEILIVSGRDDTCREDTLAWLDKHRIPYSKLLMRDSTRVKEDGNKVADTIIKKEIFDEFIRDKYNVLYVLDDRNQVVRMWRDMGLKVLQVADGDF